MNLLDKDERIRICIYLIAIFVIQGTIMLLITNNFTSEINRKYINQNLSIVGSVAELDENIAEDIIPIITGKVQGNNELGKRIMKSYSYNEMLKSENNPLIEGTLGGYRALMLISIFVILLLALIGVIYLINPIYKEIILLTRRAENIVENRFTSRNENTYKGSLEKFIYKFNGMEDRILNSIDLLKNEKINLKNIINDISHQLKTPLMALTMYNDILQDHENMETVEIDSFINLSQEQLERMEWLVKTLLKYARLESNVVEYHKEKLSLNNTIEEAINPLIFMAEAKEQNLIFKEEKEINFYHDRAWLGEAISNIIKNAIEHTPTKGKIEVALKETPISITIAIKDNGEGIEQKELKKIFNRFHKGENSLNPSSIGIGLCLSKAIVAAHEGDITVESEFGKGSTFYISFLKIIK